MRGFGTYILRDEPQSQKTCESERSSCCCVRPNIIFMAALSLNIAKLIII